MRLYEIVLILDSSLEDEEIQGLIDRVGSLVTSQGGEVVDIDRWGRRRFSYELADRWEGYYTIVQAQGEPEMVTEVDRNLSITDEVLRHKIVRLPSHVAQRVLARANTAPSSED